MCVGEREGKKVRERKIKNVYEKECMTESMREEVRKRMRVKEYT